MKKSIRLISVVITFTSYVLVSFISCKKEIKNPGTFTTGFWNINLSSSFLIPSDAGSANRGYALLYLMDNNKLYYDIYLDKVKQGVTPTTATISFGSPLENKETVIDLKPANFAGNKAKGSVDVSAAIVDSLKNNPKAYILIRNQNIAIARGQLNVNITYGADADLKPGVSDPSLAQTKGQIALRLQADNILNYIIKVDNLPVGDTLKSADMISLIDTNSIIQIASDYKNYNKPVSLSISSIDTTGGFKFKIRSVKFPDGILVGTTK